MRVTQSTGGAAARNRARRWVATVAVASLALAAGACGGDDGSGPAELNWFIFNEPSGVLPKVADECSKASNGEYTINFEFLPADADSQREQLVRRLGAEDDSIDIVGMDVVWTGEFANAGWIEEWTGQDKAAVTDGVFPNVVDTASYEGKLWTAPIWSNTQLLWYRKDRIPRPPETWDQMFRIAGDLGKDNLIQVQGDRYEGLTVWVNSMVASAGTTIVEPDDPEQVALAEGPTDTALGTMGELANSPYADSSLSTSTEDSARLSFESGNSAFMLNYPFVYPSAKENAPEVFKNLAAARYPRVVADIPSAPPLGGINLGVSAFSKKQDQAFDAIKCLVQPDNQLEIASAAGLPPVVESVYRSREIEKVYPGFADLMRESIKAAAPRPVTPAYQDLTLAIQRVVHPVADIDPDDPGPTTEELRDKVETALKREGLL